MRTARITSDDVRGVFAVPPLARASDPDGSIAIDQNAKLLQHMVDGGITRFLYGGNALLYHITLSDYETLLNWLAKQSDNLWMIPSAGPSFGRALDQARLLRRHRFPCVMMLPCGDPRDAKGLERGIREVVQSAGMPVIIYLKAEDSFGADKTAGLEAISRLMAGGDCVAVKYAVERADPGCDNYLAELLRRVDVKHIVSGIGERPAVKHMQQWKLAGFTTGSGALAPHVTCSLYEACRSGDFQQAAELRETFMPLEDLRDAWGPSRVLHEAVALCGIAQTGPLLPFLSGLDEAQLEQLAPVVKQLVQCDRSLATGD